MRRFPGKIVITLFALIASTGIPLIADTPFSDNIISITQTANSGTDTNTSSVPAGSVDQILTQVAAGNAYAGAYGENHLIKNGIVKVRINLKDETGGEYKRASLLAQILSEHGCKITTQQVGEKQTGNIFNRKKWMEASYDFEAKDYVADKLVPYYAGQKLGDVSPASIPNAPELADAVAVEKHCIEDEKAVIDLELELDKLYISLSKRGTFDLSGKKADKARIDEIINNLIPAKKSAIASERQDVDKKLADLASSYQKKGDYNQALAYYKLHGINDNTSRQNAGDCYKALKSYDSAISMYKSINPITEAASLNIADCQHAKGNDQDAVKSLFDVLGNFHNSPEELSALQKFDDWKIVDRSSEFPNVAPQLGDVYLSKSFLNANSPSSVGTAAQDYKKGCGLKAAGNAAAGSQQLIAGYQAAVDKGNQDLSSARQQASNRFLQEREMQRQNLVRAETNYNLALTSAAVAYTNDLNAAAYRLRRAQERLTYLQSLPPTTSGGTDPYSRPTSGGTDPYSGSSSSHGSTDPYSGTSSSHGSTDPYAPSHSSSTDPYSQSSNYGTDPYDSYNSVSDAQAAVYQFQNDYNYLAYHQAAYVATRVAPELLIYTTAQANYRNYDLSRQTAYVENDPTVLQIKNVIANNQKCLATSKQLATANGFSS
ncbi:MAG: tetratricopeptide repeat protein [Candidatus Riflebacteria bacterium]|nr:tetratricopeptide repeat protein [Candidatus Riflebacteria bacterium]